MLEFLPKEVRPIAGGMGKLLILVLMIVYIISPIDFLPEALLGPFGLIDDLLVLIFGVSILGYDLLGKGKGLMTKRQTYQQSKKK